MRIIRHMSILERLIEDDQPQRSYVEQIVDIVKQVERVYGDSRAFIVVGHSLGSDSYKILLSMII